MKDLCITSLFLVTTATTTFPVTQEYQSLTVVVPQLQPPKEFFLIALARGCYLHRSAMKLHEALQQLCVQANRTWTRPLLHPNASAPRCWLFKSYVELMLPALIVMTDIRRTQAEPTFETSGPPSIGTVVFEPT